MVSYEFNCVPKRNESIFQNISDPVDDEVCMEVGWVIEYSFQLTEFENLADLYVLYSRLFLLIGEILGKYLMFITPLSDMEIYLIRLRLQC